MVAVVGRAQTREFVWIFCPVELAAVDDAAADGRRVTFHVLGGGVGDDVGSPLKRAAVDWRGKGVVDDQRYAVLVGGAGEFFYIKHCQSRIGDGLAENRLRVGTESSIKLFRRAVRSDEGEVDAHALHGHGKEVKGSAVDG